MERPNWISTLLEQGSLPYSQVGSQAATQILSKLTALGLVKIETQKSRRKIVVLEAGQFRRWVEATYPPVDPLALADLPARSQNIARRRSSKAGRTTHEVQPVLLRWFDPNPATPLAQLTAQYGLVGLTADRLSYLSPAQPWWLLTVENWETFYRLDYPAPSRPIVALYLGGHIADVTLAALAQLNPARVLHFGDYDWTGLSIFQRLQAALPAASLYVPDQLEALFRQHGNRRLIEDQASGVQLNLAQPACRSVIDLIARYNVGLEQEIVPPPTEAYFESLT